ncbi:DegT/DnrJ/EryC1/StrS family aminotransferase [Streptomyces sp. HU2014]|uniref:DegT/DnrJ/EryC1/StrS family aminotransferase n=1 Tax=Streptomyces sp. HU2014 TaxID=2939414 RepID=UPI00200F595F|nr:DegT/DnrJ/EryC1/StrS family aminotransferase [Streptomyces sp. HU2014]UQI47365.1 DegT/DnrJ/EryC1/StrS family aminotransferase [Streptomyces sp. HU2014]
MNVPFLDLKAPYRELRADIDAALGRVAASGRYLLGPELDAFEAEFAAYCGNEHCVAVGSGCDALELALRALGIGPGDEVVVPAHTFIATWLAVSATGARPVPVDPSPDGLSMDLGLVEAALTPRTRAVLPVHLYGHPADMDPLLELAGRHGLAVVEDAAQAHGARYRGRRTGSGHVVAFSFYPGKNLGAMGDGGAVVTADAAVAERVRLLRNFGSREKYRHEVRAGNSRLDEFQAAVLRAKLPRLDAWNARRAAVAARYREGLAGLPGIVLPEAAPWADPVWHLYVIRSAERDALRRELDRAGVATLIHYPVPPHRSPAYADDPAGAPEGTHPRTERLAAQVLSLPLGPHLGDDEAGAVVAAVAAAVAATGGAGAGRRLPQPTEKR